MYLVGIVAAAGVALVLKRTLLRGPTPPFVMELPSYKWPSPRIVLLRMAERGWSFVYRAGTLILAVSILIWAASYYPHNSSEVDSHAGAAARCAGGATLRSCRRIRPSWRALDRAAGRRRARDRGGLSARQLSWARAGMAIEPAVRPLGWDWRIGCAAIASFPAREVVMGALGVIYNLGSDLDVGEQADQDRLAAPDAGRGVGRQRRAGL